MDSQSTYVMESPREGARLEAKTNPDAAEAQLKLSGLHSGMRALDVGCGTGAVTRIMARLAAPASVTGINVSEIRIEQARQLAEEHNAEIEFTSGDATGLPFPSDSFDYSWSRFLFEYLPNPQRALSELVRVTRPGGIVTVADLDGQVEQFYPLRPSLRGDLTVALQMLGETGFDPFVGRKLFHWFYQAGLTEIAVHAVPYQVYAGSLPDIQVFDWEEKVTTVSRWLIERTGETQRWQQWRSEFLAHLTSPDTFYYCTLILVQGIVPENKTQRS